MKFNKKAAIPAGISAVTLISALMLGYNAKPITADSTLSDRMDTAYKYINELDYEQAIAEFKAILEIDPQNIDAYLGLANVYMLNGNGKRQLKMYLD